jgi:hypothetical protein
MGTVNTCQTCRYWQRQEVEVYRSKRHNDYRSFYGTNCELVNKQPTNYGACTCPKLKYEYLEEVDKITGEVLPIEIDGLQYYDGENYSAYLVTGEEFGCIHHLAIT